MNTYAVITLLGTKQVNVVWITFWVVVGLGIVAAGGVYGCCVMANHIAIFGLPVGMIIAAISAVPFIVAAATLMWAFWMERFAMAFAAAAGGVTGYLAASRLAVPEPISIQFSVWLAAFLGTIGGGLAAHIYLRSQAIDDEDVSATDNEKWSYSLQDLFVRFTLVTALIAAWTFAITEFRATRAHIAEFERTNND